MKDRWNLKRANCLVFCKKLINQKAPNSVKQENMASQIIRTSLLIVFSRCHFWFLRVELQQTLFIRDLTEIAEANLGSVHCVKSIRNWRFYLSILTSVWMRWFSEEISVFILNPRKHGPEKLQIKALFTYWYLGLRWVKTFQIVLKVIIKLELY